MARMSRKLERTLSTKMLPIVQDRASAIEARDEALALIPELRADLERYGSLTERARLARFLSEVAEWSLLLEDPAETGLLLDEAYDLLAQDERHAPMQLARGRMAWAMILRGQDIAKAKEILVELLGDRDPSVAAWLDTHLLYLAAAFYHEGDDAQVAKALSAALSFYEQQPRRDQTLVRQALALLGARSES